MEYLIAYLIVGILIAFYYRENEAGLPISYKISFFVVRTIIWPLLIPFVVISLL